MPADPSGFSQFSKLMQFAIGSRRVARRSILIALVGALAALAGVAAASNPRNGAHKRLWATINVCGKPGSPNLLGIRGQMPGDGTHERMFMRFTAQFRGQHGWQTIAGSGVSGWRAVGSALFRFEQDGYNFSLNPPQPGTSYLLRGSVEFEWRTKRHHRTVVVRRARALTEARHPSPGSYPRGYSAAICRMSTPAGH